MGLFDFLDKRKKDKRMDTMAHSNDLSMEQMAEIQKTMEEKMSPETYNSNFNQACRVMTSGNYQEAIALFEQDRAQATDNETKGTCENQIGACYYFLNEFEKAIPYYVESLGNGFYPDVADDNIWESCEELIKREIEPKKWAQLYMQTLPEGKYVSQAQNYI